MKKFFKVMMKSYEGIERFSKCVVVVNSAMDVCARARVEKRMKNCE